MAKLKSIAFAVGILLLIGAALCLYFSLRNLSSIRPASAYEDMGVHTFVPEEVYPVQRENHATGRQKRNHPTTTVYIVRYRVGRKFILYRGRTTLPGGRSAATPPRPSTSCAIRQRTGAAINTSMSPAP